KEPWGPDEPKSTPNGKTLPCLTRLAACATFSAVIRFRVPSSSASPHLPQLRTSSATRRKSLRLAILRPFQLVGHVAEHPLCHRTAVHPDHLAGDVPCRVAVQKHQHTCLLVWTCDPAQWCLEGIEELLPVCAAELVED